MTVSFFARLLRCCQLRTYRWELSTRCADHAELSDFASSSQIEESQAYHADFLVRTRRSACDEAGGVLACSHLRRCQLERGVRLGSLTNHANI